MTEKQISLVKRSWKIMSKIEAELLGDAFYSKLFMDWPELKPMFKTNRQEQSRKLIAMLNTVVTSLDRLSELQSSITALAQRHKQYGALPSHYDKVGDALLWTIKSTLGNDFDQETNVAWQTCYAALKTAILNAY